MTKSEPRLVAALALALFSAVVLSGCVTLFPKADPVVLYRFDARQAAYQPDPAALARPAFAMSRGATSFPRAAAGDRILTATGSQVAYIADARWVSPASALFDEAVQRAFAEFPPVRPAPIGEPGRADYLLRLDVTTFEARYVNGAGTAPTIVVSVRATLVNTQNLGRDAQRPAVQSRMFQAEAVAGENRVTAIVAAFDAATTQVLGELRAWVAQNGRRV